MGFYQSKDRGKNVFHVRFSVSKENVMALMANGLNFESCCSNSMKQHHSCETQQEVWVWADL